MVEHGIDFEALAKFISVIANLIAIPAIKGIWTLIRRIERMEVKQAIMLQALVNAGLIKPFGELASDSDKTPDFKATEKES